MQLNRADIRAWIEQTDSSLPVTWFSVSNDFWIHYGLALAGDLESFKTLGQLAIKKAEMLGFDIVTPAIKTNETKGADYTGNSPDPLNNFYKVEAKLVQAGYSCVDALTVWGVYVAKHLDAIETWQLTGRVSSEPIESRLMDVLVYSALGYFILLRKKGVSHATSRPATELGGTAATSDGPSQDDRALCTASA